MDNSSSLNEPQVFPLPPLVGTASPEDWEKRKDIAAFAQKQQKIAFERFYSRRGFDWKVSFGLWTALGVASGLMVNASNWHPQWGVALSVTVIASVAALGFWGWWAPWVRTARDRDLRQAYWWGSVVESMIAIRLRQELRPGEKPDFIGKPWRRYEDDSKPEEASKPAQESASDATPVHALVKFLGDKTRDSIGMSTDSSHHWRFQTLITVLMSLLLITAVWTRVWTADTQDRHIEI
jgi:hypothetical protein